MPHAFSPFSMLLVLLLLASIGAVATPAARRTAFTHSGHRLPRRLAQGRVGSVAVAAGIAAAAPAPAPALAPAPATDSAASAFLVAVSVPMAAPWGIGAWAGRLCWLGRRCMGASQGRRPRNRRRGRRLRCSFGRERGNAWVGRRWHGARAALATLLPLLLHTRHITLDIGVLPRGRSLPPNARQRCRCTQ